MRNCYDAGMEGGGPSSRRQAAKPLPQRPAAAGTDGRAAASAGRRRHPSPATDVPRHAAGLFDALECGVVVVDEAGVVRYANGTAHEHLGALDRRLTGRCVRDPGWAGAILVDERGEPIDPQRFPPVEVLDGAEFSCAILGVAPQANVVPDWLEVSARAVVLAGRRQAVCTLHPAPGNTTQRSLWARANRLRTLLDSLPGAYFVLNEADEVIECSHGMLDYRRDEGYDSPLGHRLPVLLSEQAAVDAEEALAETRTLGAAEFEIEWPGADEPRFFEAYCRLLPGRHVSVLLRDVTDRWRAEEELFALEEVHRLVADGARDVIYRMVMKPTPRLQYVSPSAERVLGYTPDEFYADDTLIYKVPRADFFPLLRDQAAGLLDWDQPVEICVLHKDCSERWIEETVTPELDEDGSALVMDVVMRDITERRRQAEALQRSEARFRLLAEHARDIVWGVRLRPDMAWEYISPSVERFLGYSAEELMADPWFFRRLIADDSQPQLQRVLAGELDTDEALLVAWRHKDGGLVWSEGTITLLHDEDGTLVGAQGIMRDVTKRVREAAPAQ
jgi:PAS domain S-box-containing protein